jgi:AraC family transcriptional regulator
MRSPNTNVHGEVALLPAGALDAWQGFPVTLLRASPEVDTRDFVPPKPVLAMIDAGTAQASFGFGRRAQDADLRAGCVGFFAAGTEMRYSRWRCQAARRIVVELDFERLTSLGPPRDWQFTPADTEIVFQDEELCAVMRSMVREVAAGCPSGRLYAEALSLGVAMRLQQRAGHGDAMRRDRGKLSRAHVQMLEELVRSELDGEMPLARLAESCGFSPAHFMRLFRNTFGCTPHKYVQAIRLARARELTVDGELPLLVIAELTGFASQSHMTRAFAQEYGVPPGEMRRQARARVAPRARQS